MYEVRKEKLMKGKNWLTESGKTPVTQIMDFWMGRCSKSQKLMNNYDAVVVSWKDVALINKKDRLVFKFW